MCEEYCHRKCKSCNQTRTDCIECAEFYVKDDKGQCVVESRALDICARARPLLNFIKRRGVKSLLLAVDDLWLYNYHRNQYDGTALVVFETIQFIQEQQYEVVGLDDAKEEIETSVVDTKIDPNLVSEIISSTTVTSSLKDRVSYGSSGYAEQKRMISDRIEKINNSRTDMTARENKIKSSLLYLDQQVTEIIKKRV